jgi:hypothetical protein
MLTLGDLYITDENFETKENGDGLIDCLITS